jgi:membrane protein implicated in regulation of membrane protease activity
MLLIVYAAVCVCSGILLFLMAFLGGDYDTDADIDIEADLDVGADVDMNMDAGEFGGPGKLSIKLIMFFLIGFGLCGFMAVQFKWPVHHVFWAMGGGVVVWYIGYKLLGLLYSQQSNSQLRARMFVGKEGRVTVPIPKDGGTGEIEATDNETGRTAHFSARSSDPEKGHDRGRTVKIKSVTGGTAVVE